MHALFAVLGVIATVVVIVLVLAAIVIGVIWWAMNSKDGMR